MVKTYLEWNKKTNVGNKWAKGDFKMANLNGLVFNSDDDLKSKLAEQGIKIKYKLRDEIFVQVPGLKQTRSFKIKKINI